MDTFLKILIFPKTWPLGCCSWKHRLDGWRSQNPSTVLLEVSVVKAVDTNWYSGITVTLHHYSHDTELSTAKCQNYYVPKRFTVITITAVRLTQKSAPAPPQPLRPSLWCWFLLTKLSVRVSTLRDCTWQSTHQQWVGNAESVSRY